MNDFNDPFGNEFSAASFSLKRKMELECSLHDYQLEIPSIGNKKKPRTDEVLTANGFHDEPHTQMVFDPKYDQPKDINFGFKVNASSGKINAPQNADNVQINLQEERLELNGQLFREPGSMPEAEPMDHVDESQEIRTDNHVNTVRNSTCEVIIEDRRFLNAPSFCRPEGMWDTMLDVRMYHGL